MMKKSFRRGAALLLTFAMLLGLGCVPASATVTTDGYGKEIYKDDFNKQEWNTNTTGQYRGESDPKPSIVKSPVDEENHNYVAKMPGVDKNGAVQEQYLGCVNTLVNAGYNWDGSGTWLTAEQAKAYSKMKVTADMMVSTAFQNFSFSVRFGKVNDAVWDTVVQTTKAGEIMSGSTKLMDYELDTWYSVEVYYDFETHTRQIYINGELKHSAAIDINYLYVNDFRVTKAEATNPGDVYADNLSMMLPSVPTFESVSPADGTEGFPVAGGTVEFAFSNPMDETQTVAASISGGTTNVTAAATVKGNKISVTNANALDFDTEYTFTIPAGTKDCNGKELAEEQSVKVKTAAKADIYSEKIDAEPTEDGNKTTITASTKVSNPDAEKKISVALVIAAFNKDGLMIGHKIQTIEVAAGATGTAISGALENLDAEEADKIYVYAVDGKTLSKPLTPSAIVFTKGESEMTQTEMAIGCKPTSVTLDPLAIDDEGKITVSGSVTPKEKTVVYINVQGPKKSENSGIAAASDIALYANEADEETEPSALIPILTEDDGSFKLEYTPENFVSGEYTVSVGGWQSESKSSSRFCIDKTTQGKILDAVNDANNVTALMDGLEQYEYLLSDDDSIFCQNGYQTVLEQRPKNGYEKVSDITDMFTKAQTLLKDVNDADASELAEVMEKDADVILYGWESLDDFNKLTKENKARVCGFMNKGESDILSDFAGVRSTLDTAFGIYNGIIDDVKKATTAEEVGTVLERHQTELKENASLFCANAYQTLFEQKVYSGVEEIVAMMKKAQSLLDTVNNTDWSKLASVLTNDENKGILFYQYEAIETFAASDTEVQNKICGYMNSDKQYKTFADLRTSMTNATTKYKDEVAKLDEPLQGGTTSGLGGGGRTSVTGGSKGNVSGVLYVDGVTATPTPSATPVPTPSTVAETPFADMKDAAWASEHVAALAEKGIISGDANGNFRPNDAVTREEFVKLLVGALGIEVGEAGESFADADVNAWYAKYLAAAKAAGIITGNEDGTFGVGNEITRQDMAVMAVRAVNAIGKTLPSGGATFSDSDSISSYAAQAVGQMQAAGILNGIGNGTFAPMDSTSRAASAKVINSLMNLVIGK